MDVMFLSQNLYLNVFMVFNTSVSSFPRRRLSQLQKSQILPYRHSGLDPESRIF